MEESRESASRKVVSYAAMNPVLWGSLPRELVALVLAHLPVPEIARLRCHLSKSVWTPMASDGGLVCFVSTWNYTEANALCIVMINPLTRVQHKLPPLQHVYTVPPKLLYMKVDLETKGFKVVVVGKNKKKGRHTVETSDSVSRQWTRGAPSWGHILGIACKSKLRHRLHDLFQSNFCAYDLEGGQLEYFDSTSFQSIGEEGVMRWALAGDRMFVLHKKENRHGIASVFCFITEFQFQKSVGVWVPLRTHGQCFPEEKNCFYDLLACEGFLMLHKTFFSKNNMICSFRNFSTSEWQRLPENPQNIHIASRMCRVNWHVIP